MFMVQLVIGGVRSFVGRHWSTTEEFDILALDGEAALGEGG